MPLELTSQRQRPALRRSWQFAVFGLVGFVLLWVVCEVGRACGLIEFWIERLPGELLGTPFPLSSYSADIIAYLGFGALLGLAYRPIFLYYGRANWRIGLAVGFLQWLLFGVVIALLEPVLTLNFPMLPTQSPLHSVSGFMWMIGILLANCVFGVYMGLLAETRQPAETLEGPQEQIGPPLHKAA